MIFCKIVATVVATKHPDVTTVERMVKRRPKGTVYIDYLQNIYGKTLAAAYSARATEFVGVSTPLMWKEVHEGGETWSHAEDVHDADDLRAARRSRRPLVSVAYVRTGTARGGIRIRSAMSVRDMIPHCAPVAQLDRAPGFEPVGRGFKSLRARHLFVVR